MNLSQSNLPSMATCEPSNLTFPPENYSFWSSRDDSHDSKSHDSELHDFEVVNMGESEKKEADALVAAKVPTIIKCVVPVFNKKSSSWRIECNREGSYIKISLVPDSSSEIDDFITQIITFLITTFLGNPKRSSSSRGALKFEVPINTLVTNTNTNETYFRTPIIKVDGKYRIYDFVVKCENYEHTSYDLRYLLNKHYQHMYGVRDEMGLIDDSYISSSVVYELNSQYGKNDKFVKNLFKVSQ